MNNRVDNNRNHEQQKSIKSVKSLASKNKEISKSNIKENQFEVSNQNNQISQSDTLPGNNMQYVITFTFEDTFLNIPLSNLNIPCPIIYNQISALIQKIQSTQGGSKKKVYNFI